MSDLVAITYDDEETAEPIRRTLADLRAREGGVEFDAVVVTRDESGKAGLHQAPACTLASGARLHQAFHPLC